MRQRILMGFLVWLLMTPCLVLADRIDRVQGPTIEGRIMGANEEGVQIKPASSKMILIPHAEIKRILFTWADIVYLKSGDVLNCKIVNRIPPDMVIVTETGEQRIRFADIQMFYYHSAKNLRVPSLPVTGDDFKNERSLTESDLRRRFYGGIILGTHMPPIADWKDQFMAATCMFSGGCRAGVYVKPSMSLNLGFKYSIYNFLHYGHFKTEFGRMFVFGGIEWVKQLSSTPIIYSFVGIDAGLLYASGHLYLYSYRKVNFKDSTVGFLPRAGIRLHIGGRFTLDLEAGYLVVKQISVPTGYGNSLDLDFDGLSSFFNILLHI